MLIEHDAHARHVAVALAVVTSELRKIAPPTEAYRTLLSQLQRAQERSEHLADALCEIETTPRSPRLRRRPIPAQPSNSNVIPFARRA